MTILRFLLPAILLLTPLWADSPITSTDFYVVYQDNKLVSRARETRLLDSEMLRFISNRYEPVDVKAAMINALSWDNSGDENTRRLHDYLTGQYGGEENWPGRLSGAEWLCMGYMRAMDDYHNPSPALYYLEKAREALPDSYTAHIIYAIVDAQAIMDQDWCEVWRKAEAVENNANLTRDMEAEAREIIIDYLKIYGDYCDRQPKALAEPAYDDPCEGAMTQMELNDCHEKRYIRANNRLEELYQLIMQKADVETARQLRQAQRDWITFRDSNCMARSESYRGGTAYAMMHLACMAELTEARIKELLAFYEEINR